MNEEGQRHMDSIHGQAAARSTHLQHVEGQVEVGVLGLHTHVSATQGSCRSALAQLEELRRMRASTFAVL